MKVLVSTVGLAVTLLGSSISQAQQSVTVDLGATLQNFVEYGLGGNAGGYSTYALDQGACVTGANTTCTLSGTFTGSTPGFTSGTYSLVTTYNGTADGVHSPILAISSYVGSDYFNYLSLPASAAVTLDLTTSKGTFAEPIITGGSFDAGTGINFIYQNYVCSGVTVSPCTAAEVGLVDGAIGQGVVTGAVAFEVAAAVPEPATNATMLAGLCVIGAGYGMRRKRIRLASSAVA